MATWTVKQVTSWLKENGFRKQTKLFKDKNIDGHTLLRLTDDDISQLFSEVNEDGTIQESTIGAKSRFRIKLIEWKIDNNQNESVDESSTIVLTDSHQNKHQEEIIPKKPKKKESDYVKRKGTYLIDDEIQIQFFKKPKFLPYFIHYIQQETIPIEIEITPIDSNQDESLFGYTLQLNGTKQENRIVRNFIKDLLNSIKTKTYEQKKIQNYSFKFKSVHIIENILDKESQLFTVCQLFHQRLEISYFDNEKFHSSKNLIEMDHIIQNQIVQEDILWSAIENRHMVEFLRFNTREMLWKYQICVTEQFSKELEDLFNQYQDDSSLVSVHLYEKNRVKTKRTIEIFGYRTSVDEVLQKFQDLFVQHQLRKFRFGQISSMQLDCLANLCSKEFRSIEREFRNGCVELHIQKNEFYAPQCFKDQIRNRIKNFLTMIQKKTLSNIELYYHTADEKLGLNMKNLARRNRCYCDIQLRMKMKSYPIPRGEENRSNTSKLIIEQSELFCSSSLVFCQTKLANGTIEVLIGDIALQKVNILIIPATSCGLKESLIERAGEIIEKASSLNPKNSIPFITETTGGKLNCQKILFVNWSLPTLGTNDEDLCQSIRLFISKSIEYVTTDCEQSNVKVQSIALAVPDACEQEDIFAEEIIEETIKQINLTKFVSLKVAFILLPDQQILHKQFVNIIRNVQKGEDSFGSFYCSASTVTATLMSLEEDYLRKCEEKINNYVKRSQYKMKLDGFQNWNQYMINAFYKFSTDRYVLPKIDKQQQIVLYGPINNVHEVYQNYQLTNALIQQKINLANPFSIMFSYSQEDSIISHRLAHRLIDEGFSVWINSNHSIEFDEILTKITKSDCIILCTSGNYFQNELCEKQAKYAEQIGKYLILVKVEYYQPIEWLQKLVEKQSYFQFFGSDQHFNFEYDKLLLKILQYTKLASVSLVDQTSDASQQNDIGLYFLLTPEQKKLKYQKNVKKLMKLKKGRITADDKNDLSEKIQDILQRKENYWEKYISKNKSNWFSPLHRYYEHLANSTSLDDQQRQDELRQVISFDIGIMSYRQWLDKLGHLKTILNIAPFTFTGDINDAVFPLLSEVLRNPNLLLSLRNHYSMSFESDSSSEEDDAPVRNYLSKLNRRNITNDKSKTDERSSVVSRISNNSVKRSAKVNEFKEEKKWRRVIPKKSATNGSFSKSIKMEFQSKFAEQMRKNEEEFQKFCEDNEHSAPSPKKQKIQTYPTAIFGASPFSDIKLEPRKTYSSRNPIPLPLKFPWNGVFDTKTPSITWTNPSILFFFQAPSSEQY